MVLYRAHEASHQVLIGRGSDIMGKGGESLDECHT
jgi:hypothetical protein